MREHDPIAYDLFNIHEKDPKIKPDVFVSKQHVSRVSPTTLKNLAGQILGLNQLSLNKFYKTNWNWHEFHIIQKQMVSDLYA